MRGLALSGLVLACASVASAQGPGLGLGRRLDSPVPQAPARTGPEDERAEEPREPWGGPQIELGYAYWKLADAHGGGDVHAATVEAFVRWPIPELRTGLLGEVGGRDYSLAGDDLLLRGGVEVGVQLPGLLDPLVPHVSALFTFGGLIGQRFETTVAYGFAGGGLELGAALRVLRNLHLDAALSYLRLEMDGAAFDVFMFRAGIGL